MLVPLLQVGSYWAMLLRVRRIEGWSGLFKGIMPMATSIVVITVFSAIWVGSASLAAPRAGKYTAPVGTWFEMLIYTLFISIVSVPLTLIVNRAICTPHKLPTFNPLVGLSILLTEHERSRPWVLFMTPGLVAAQVLHILYVVVILHTFRRILLPSSFLIDGFADDEGKPRWPADFTTLRFGGYFLVLAASVPVLCGLEVIMTRLSLQRNHAPHGEFVAVSQEDATAAAEDDIEFAGLEEDVIGLRAEGDPYSGLLDCATRIHNEEGVQVLLRGWWITLMGGVLSVFG